MMPAMTSPSVARRMSRGHLFGYAGGSSNVRFFYSHSPDELAVAALILKKKGFKTKIDRVAAPVDGRRYVLLTDASTSELAEATRKAIARAEGRATGSIDGKVGLRFHGRWSDDDGKKPMHLTEPLSIFPDKFKAKISTDVEAEDAYEVIDAPEYEVLEETGSASGRAKRRIYATTYCNKGHYVDTGKPVGHECITIPPAALRAEMEGDYDKAIEIMQKRRSGSASGRKPKKKARAKKKSSCGCGG